MHRPGLGEGVFLEVRARAAAVDHDDIRRVAARVLAAEPTLAAVGPVRERDITW